MSSPSDLVLELEGDDWATGLLAPDEDVAPPLVVVIDTGLVIEVKHQVPVQKGQQWDLLERMLELVKAGRLVFPRHVGRELVELDFPDAPGAWCGGAIRWVKHEGPDDAALVSVLEVAPGLVDEFADNTREKADPYVVAMAHGLRHKGFDAVVATTDVKDRPPLISVKSACALLDISCWDFATFRAWVEEMTSPPDPAQMTDELDDEFDNFDELAHDKAESA